jgi:hypothetical protein
VANTLAIIESGSDKLLTQNDNPDSMEYMKTRTIALTLAYCLFGVVLCFAADPHMGTWKLNEAKSNVTPGTLKYNIVTVENMFEKVKVTADGIDADGKPVHTRSQTLGRTPRSMIER